jgi:antitoxin (DNA-binding transcriptional repressor) of toxin-antitoxin stability system
MRVTITKFRQHLFKLVDHSLAGESLEFIHRGIVFKVLPEKRVSKLSKLTAQTVIARDVDLTQINLLEEMEEDWLKDWSEI